MLGRKLLPIERPRTPLEKFAWLVRAQRIYHPNADFQNTSRFAQILSSHLSENLKPETINKLETGALPFSIERALAYEQVLAMRTNSLVDPFVWLSRASGQDPRTSWARLREASAQEIELLVRVGYGEALTGLEWLNLSMLYKNRKDLIVKSPRVRDAFFEGLMRDIGNAFEAEERLMREALINIGPDSVPLLSNCVATEPTRYFFPSEALGYIPGKESWQALLTLKEFLHDALMASPLIESIVRAAAARQVSITDCAVYDELKNYSLEALGRSSELFAARETAAAFLLDPAVRLSNREGRYISQYREDLRHLVMVPRGHSRREIMEEVDHRFQASVMRVDGHVPGVPLTPPGLSSLISEGIFAKARLRRIMIGVLLSGWSRSESITNALGETLGHLSKDDYGVQRSFVRLMTKIGSRNSARYFTALARSGIHDESVRLSVAWAFGIGIGTGPDDEMTLRVLYEESNSESTKRAVSVAAARRRFHTLLSEIALDDNDVVSREAKAVLARVDLVERVDSGENQAE